MGAAVAGMLLAGVASGVAVPRASAETGFQDLTVTQEFTSSDTAYGYYVTKNDTVAVELHNPNPATARIDACVVASTTPTGECYGNNDDWEDTDYGFRFLVDSSLGQVHIEVDYAADPMAASPDVSKIYTVTWTPPTVLTTIPAGPTQAGNVLTFPSETGVEYWVSDGWVRATGSYTLTTTTTVYSAPADGYVFAPPGDEGWYVPTYYRAIPPAPTRSGNVLDIPTTEGVTYLVNGTPVTGSYAMTANTTVQAQAAEFYFFTAGTSATWSYTYTASAPAPVAIKAAALKVTRKPTPTRVGRATYAITSVNGTLVNGSATLVIVRGGTVKKVAVTVVNGRAVIRVPKLRRGTWKFQVRFRANAKFKAFNTRVYTVKV